MVTKGKPALFLAPMEGVTDGPMRALMTEIPGFTHCVTEFLRISQMVLPKKSYRRHAYELGIGSRTPTGIPVIFQLLGGDAEKLAQSAALAVQEGAAGIDLNFGCPAPTVNKHDGGATLLKYPARIEEIVRAVRKSVPAGVPVSAKLRLGWDSMDSIFENAERAASGGASWITVHGRTKMQGYMPPAYWGPIAILQKNLSIPVIANGEIWTREDFLRCQDETKCEHYMIGRGALANPFLATQIANELGIIASEKNIPSTEEWRALLTRFVEISEPISSNPNYTIKRVKQWLRYASQRGNFHGFDQIKRIETTAEFMKSLPALVFN